MTTSTESTITHPAWCDLQRCSTDERSDPRHPDVMHWGVESTYTMNGDTGITVLLARGDESSVPGNTIVYFDGDIAGEFSPDNFEALGRWLLQRAAEYRQAIATEDGAR